VNHLKKRQRVANFVVLKMPDKMPPYTRWQLRDFYARFLDTTFPEQGLSCLNRLAHFVGWVRFRDRNQFDFINGTAGFCGRLPDLFAYTFQVFGDRSHTRL